jgi:hypothetical protein
MTTPVHYPREKADLYLHKDWGSPFFNNAAEFNTTSAGLPMKSDTSSQQQVTQMLGTLGAIANQVAGAAKGFKFLTSDEEKREDLPKQCQNRLSIIADTHFAGEIHVLDVAESQGFDWKTDTKRINDALKAVLPPPLEKPNEKPLAPDVDLQIQIKDTTSRDSIIFNDLFLKTTKSFKTSFDGFVAYEPSTAEIQLVCVRKTGDQTPISSFGPPHVIPVYTIRRQVSPERRFWTNPTDTYSFNEGIITGHKYTDQSPVKTAVDLITAPVRAFLPATTTTTTTSVQTSPGKPDTTTNTTAIQQGPPKP